MSNPSFEAGRAGWANLGTSASTSGVSTAEIHAAVNGKGFASLRGGTAAISQAVAGVTIEAGKTYTVTAWARGVNAVGKMGVAAAEIALTAATAVVTKTTVTVGVTTPKGIAKAGPNDDGANIWIENDYRLHVAGHVWYQYPASSTDPLIAEWKEGRGEAFDGMAHAQITTPEGLNAVYGTFYDDAKTLRSRIELQKITGTAPNLKEKAATGEDAAGDIFDTVLANNGNEDPWVIDAHLFQDDDSKLWMSWGGHQCWVSELNPKTGKLIGKPASPEFSTHPKAAHTRILGFERWRGTKHHAPSATEAPLDWEGDGISSGYMEGPAIFKKDQYYHACASYGNMGADYTIRCCRSLSVKGPYVDKDGQSCIAYDKTKSRYGASMLLGPEADQLVPGHPHIWEEKGQHYLGYDYRTHPLPSDDVMGVRKLFWGEDGWPTVWHPITTTFSADQHPEAIGKQLEVSLKSVGSSAGAVGFDHVVVTSAGGSGGGVGGGSNCKLCPKIVRGKRPIA